MNTELKARAKEQLGGSVFAHDWLAAVLVLFIVSAVLSGVTYVAKQVSFPVAVILNGPLTLATAYMFLKQSRDRQPMKLEDLLVGFSGDFLQVILLGFLNALFVTLWTMLLIVPGFIKAYAYSMAYYIKNDMPELSAMECLKKSELLMKGHKGELFLLDLSFMGWYILGALCAGVGSFWVAAYHAAARAHFYDNVIAVHEEVIP